MIAHEIMHIARNAEDAEARANDENPTICIEYDATLYRFEDGSVLLINAAQVNAYDDDTDALEAIKDPL